MKRLSYYDFQYDHQLMLSTDDPAGASEAARQLIRDVVTNDPGPDHLGYIMRLVRRPNGGWTANVMWKAKS